MTARPLVVDEEPIVQKLIARILEREGFEVMSAIRTAEVSLDFRVEAQEGAEVLKELKPILEPVLSGRPLNTQKVELDPRGGPKAFFDAAPRARARP